MSTYNDHAAHRQLWVVILIVVMLIILLVLSGSVIPAKQLSAQTLQDPGAMLVQNQPQNSVVVELFYRGDSQQSLDAKQYLETLTRNRPGVEAKAYDVMQDRDQLKRLWQISKRFGFEQAKVPSFYLCDRVHVGFQNPQSSGPKIEEMLTIKAYIRPGCKHCKAGKEFLDQMVQRWPAVKVEYHDVINNYDARAEVQRLASQFKVQVPSFPCIKVAGRLVVGFQTAEITGSKIEAMFQDRSVEFPGEKVDAQNSKQKTDVNRSSGATQNLKSSGAGIDRFQPSLFWQSSFSPTLISIVAANQVEVDNLPDEKKKNETPSPALVTGNQTPDEVPLPEDAPLPEEVPMPDDWQLPTEAGDQPVLVDELVHSGDTDEIEVPWLGVLSVSKLGLPTFTFLIGLVDGFNPCAMWVLIFLLSVLVNIKDRKKILLVAGTFVIVSGLAYFVFMAAWFNVFQFIGFLRPVQIGLGIVAIIIGVINVKDFFAFHKGVTLSIPDSAKPGIYRRVRSIVSTNHLMAALSGAIVLAIVVNIVELLCTAGLPALYTQVLTMHDLPQWANYSYLALYISAYMLDDTILVIIVVSTLSHRRLQESEGRWLKLLSGVVILGLGIVMIFWPDALI